MKLMKRIASVLLTMIMVIAMAVPAFAADSTKYTITITPGDNDKGTHTYEAYQIFKGDLSKDKNGKKVLSNIDWGNNIDSAEFLKELQKDANFAECTTASDVADKLKGIDAAKAEAFAKLAEQYPKGTPAGSAAKDIEVTGAGYYLVKDHDNSLAGQTDAAYTRYILKVVESVEVKAKAEVPTVDKKITEEGKAPVSVNEASIGESVPYTVTSHVPDMTGFEKYYFVVDDTMSGGLTFNDDVAIEIGGETLTAGTDFVVTTDPTTPVAGKETKIKIVFKNFIQYKSQKGDEIKITYSATLNDKAVIAGPNPNTVDLTYSNNPNVTDDGKPENPDEPEPTSPTGKTPESKTETYTTELTILKTDEKNNILTGAEFKLEGEGVNTVITTKGEYVVAEAGTFWKLTDGTFTTQDPNEEGMDQTKYESLTDKYKLDTKVETVDSKTAHNVQAFVDSEGKLTFTGLGAGAYKLTETTTPAGYNTISPIEFEIGFNANDKTFTSNNDKIVVGEDNKLDATIVNNSGTELPETGGIGTTIFYILGSILVVAAGVILVAKRRMKDEK